MAMAGPLLERVGKWLTMAGGIALLGIFAVVMINGHWPSWLQPVRAAFSGVASVLGEGAIVVEGLAFVGPGLVIMWIGQHLVERSGAKRKLT
jgi:hypothetical protein